VRRTEASCVSATPDNRQANQAGRDPAGEQAALVAIDTVLTPHYHTATIKRFALARKGRVLQLREAAG
jgi:hypothetical protein